MKSVMILLLFILVGFILIFGLVGMNNFDVKVLVCFFVDWLILSVKGCE